MIRNKTRFRYNSQDQEEDAFHSFPQLFGFGNQQNDEKKHLLDMIKKMVAENFTPDEEKRVEKALESVKRVEIYNLVLQKLQYGKVDENLLQTIFQRLLTLERSLKGKKGKRNLELLGKTKIHLAILESPEIPIGLKSICILTHNDEVLTTDTKEKLIKSIESDKKKAAEKVITFGRILPLQISRETKMLFNVDKLFYQAAGVEFVRFFVWSPLDGLLKDGHGHIVVYTPSTKREGYFLAEFKIPKTKRGYRIFLQIKFERDAAQMWELEENSEKHVRSMSCVDAITKRTGVRKYGDRIRVFHSSQKKQISRAVGRGLLKRRREDDSTTPNTSARTDTVISPSNRVDPNQEMVSKLLVALEDACEVTKSGTNLLQVSIGRLEEPLEKFIAHRVFKFKINGKEVEGERMFCVGGKKFGVPVEERTDDDKAELQIGVMVDNKFHVVYVKEFEFEETQRDEIAGRVVVPQPTYDDGLNPFEMFPDVGNVDEDFFENFHESGLKFLDHPDFLDLDSM